LNADAHSPTLDLAASISCCEIVMLSIAIMARSPNAGTKANMIRVVLLNILLRFISVLI
jgi:hypothetical protein